MALLGAAAVAISAVGVISSFLGSKKAAKAAKEQAAEEARLEGIVTSERLRQIGKEERNLYGETISTYAGSGVQVGHAGIGDTPLTAFGSVGQVTAEQKKEFEFEYKVTKEAGASRVQQALAGGKSLADQYKYSGYANVATGVSDILTSLAAMRK